MPDGRRTAYIATPGPRVVRHGYSRIKTKTIANTAMNTTKVTIAPSPGARARFPASGADEISVSNVAKSTIDELSASEDVLRTVLPIVVGLSVFFAVVLVVGGAIVVALVSGVPLVERMASLVVRVVGREVPFVEVRDGGDGLVATREVAVRPGVVDRVTFPETG